MSIDATRPPAPASTHVPDLRPGSDDDLGFRRMHKVRWFHPRVLLDTALRVGASAAMGDFLDKRELQQSVEGRVLEVGSGDPEVWFDFLADTGDGFDATYTMAWLTARPSLDVDGAPGPLPRGSLLVLGGDEVYPGGSAEEYDNRFRGPFRAALPYSVPGTEPRVVAIPGNHDWYDGLTNFMRIFCSSLRDGDQWIGGRRTGQTRSYFAVRLPHDWWLWGIDIQFDAYIDEPQLAYFRDVAERMGPGAKLILCTGKPSWADVQADPAAFRNLAYLEDRVIRPAGVRLLLSISGDSHHYARYETDGGTHKITSGGGGAFLHPTHHLDDPLDVPVDPSLREVVRHRLRFRYPDVRTSRRLSLGALLLPWTNLPFLVVPAVLYLLLGWTSDLTSVALRPGGAPVRELAQTFGFDDALHGLIRSQLAVVPLLVVLLALIGFAKPSADWSHGSRKVVGKLLLGGMHISLHLLVGGAVTIVAIDLAALAPGGRPGFLAALVVVFAVLGAFAAALVLGVYLGLCCALFRTHGNEAFSAMALTGYKSFLRLHVGDDGALTVYPLGVRRVSTRWRYEPDHPDPGAAWLAPESDPEVVLIEPPIVIRDVQPSLPSHQRGAS